MANNPMAHEATTLLVIGGDVDDFGKHQSEFGEGPACSPDISTTSITATFRGPGYGPARAD